VRHIGADCRLLSRVTLEHGVRLGARALVHSGAVIGSDGFGLARDGGRWLKVPQVGGVRIGDDVEIGANTTIDRGAMDDTVISDGVKLDNQIQVGHNVRSVRTRRSRPAPAFPAACASASAA
jgi:UDP-3-O-[3-hydroxymyristoyl] glucosamine N-acyltransferase